MNVSGKSLQDIFDAGEKRLEELEDTQKGAIVQATESHFATHTQDEPVARKLLEDKTQQLEEELRAYLDRGLERIEKAVASEIHENEKCVKNLVEGLVLLTKKFSESVNHLKVSSGHRLADVSKDATDQHDAEANDVHTNLLRHGLSAAQQIKDTGNVAVDESQKAVEENLHTLVEDENEAKNKLFGSYFTHLSSVKTSVTYAEERILENLSTCTKSFASFSREGQTEIKQVLERLLRGATEKTNDAEEHLQHSFKQSLDDSNGSFDYASVRAASDLESLHESSMADLSMKTQDLSRDMDSLAESIISHLADREQDLRKSGTVHMTQFTDELTRRIRSGETFRQELDDERGRLVQEIWNELEDVQSKFGEKLNSLATKTLEELKSICAEAESAITTAQEGAASEFKTISGERIASIEALATVFIDRVNARKQMALDIIHKAGTGSGAPESLKLDSTQVPAKSKRIALSREKSDEESKDSDSTPPSGGDEGSVLSEIASAITDEDKDSGTKESDTKDSAPPAAAGDAQAKDADTARDAAEASSMDTESKDTESKDAEGKSPDKPEGEVRRNPKIRVTRSEKRPPGQGEGNP